MSLPQQEPAENGPAASIIAKAAKYARRLADGSSFTSLPLTDEEAAYLASLPSSEVSGLSSAGVSGVEETSHA